MKRIFQAFGRILLAVTFLVVSSATVAGTGLCLGADGHVELEAAHSGSCYCPSYSALGGAFGAALAAAGDSLGDCACVPLSDDWESEAGRTAILNFRVKAPLADRAAPAFSDWSRAAFAVTLRPPPDTDSGAAFRIITLRTVVLLT